MQSLRYRSWFTLTLSTEKLLGPRSSVEICCRHVFCIIPARTISSPFFSWRRVSQSSWNPQTLLNIWYVWAFRNLHFVISPCFIQTEKNLNLTDYLTMVSLHDESLGPRKFGNYYAFIRVYFLNWFAFLFLTERIVGQNVFGSDGWRWRPTSGQSIDLHSWRWNPPLTHLDIFQSGCKNFEARQQTYGRNRSLPGQGHGWPVCYYKFNKF